MLTTIFMVRSCYPLTKLPCWRTTTCWLSATAYSIYSRLPSIFGGYLLHMQPKYVPHCG